MGNPWSKWARCTSKQLKGAFQKVCTMMQGNAIPYGKGQKKNTRVSSTFIWNIPLITFDRSVQNPEINLHPQKQWTYVPLSQWHWMHRGDSERFILCRVAGVLCSLWKILYRLSFSLLHVNVDLLESIAVCQSSSIYSVSPPFPLYIQEIFGNSYVTEEPISE